VLYRAVSVPLDRLVDAATALVVLSLAALLAYALVFRLAPAVVPVVDVTGVAAVWGHALAVLIGIARAPAPHELFVRLAAELPSAPGLTPTWTALAGRLLGVGLALVIVVRLVESSRRERLAYLLLAILAGVEAIVAPIFTSPHRGQRTRAMTVLAGVWTGELVYVVAIVLGVGVVYLVLRP
jgi:hypothetical protein